MTTLTKYKRHELLKFLMNGNVGVFDSDAEREKFEAHSATWPHIMIFMEQNDLREDVTAHCKMLALELERPGGSRHLVVDRLLLRIITLKKYQWQKKIIDIPDRYLTRA